MPGEILYGTITTYDDKKGSGWIGTEGGKNVFLHSTQINGFSVGDRVGFSYEKWKEGKYQARHLFQGKGDEQEAPSRVPSSTGSSASAVQIMPRIPSSTGGTSGKSLAQVKKKAFDTMDSEEDPKEWPSASETWRYDDHDDWFEDSYDDRSIVVDRGNGHSARPKGRRWQHKGRMKAAAPWPDPKLLVAEFREMTLKALKTRAREEGCDESAVEDADESSDPKQTVIDLILAKKKAAEPDQEGLLDKLLERPREAWAGTIKSYDDKKGFGFISCQDRSDVYFKASLNGFRIGDHVSFDVHRLPDGKIQARALRYPDWDAKYDNGPANGHKSSSSSPSTTFTGFLKFVSPDRGHGFIRCKEAKEACNFDGDVYVDEKHLKKYNQGDNVSFSLKMDKQGRPSAKGLSSVISVDDPDKEVDPVTYFGTIKSFVTEGADNPESGYGFIACEEIKEKYNSDAFVHYKQIKGFKQGDAVRFQVRVKDRRPQAFNLQQAPKSVSWLSSCQDELSTPSSSTRIPSSTTQRTSSGGSSASTVREDPTEYYGKIKSFNSEKGYGFIQCEAAHALYGRDVYLPLAQYAGLGVGDHVSFRIQVRRCRAGSGSGSVVAKDNNPTLDAPAAFDVVRVAQAAAPVGGELCGRDGSELDKRLLRACASARVNSTQEIDNLLEAGANPNVQDVTGQTTIMIAALQPRFSERKCRMLIEKGADVNLPSSSREGAPTVLQWARERINPKFAAFLEALSRGEAIEADSNEIALTRIPSPLDA